MKINLELYLTKAGNKENVFSENSSNSSSLEMQRIKSEYEKLKSQLSNEASKNKKLSLTMQTEMEKAKVSFELQFIFRDYLM